MNGVNGFQKCQTTTKVTGVPFHKDCQDAKVSKVVPGIKGVSKMSRGVKGDWRFV